VSAPAALAGRTATSEQAAGEQVARDWFLRDSSWHDAVWVMRPTNVLEQERPVRILWGFTLPSGRRFTDRPFAPLLEASRKLLALIRSRSLSTGLAQRATTVAGYFDYLRQLVRWMETAGFTRFADLDATALLQFQRAIARRTNPKGAPLASTTVQKYLHLLLYLHRYRTEIGDGLTLDPCPGQSAGALAHVRENDIRRWPHTPDAIAIPLLQRAIEFLSSCALDLLRAREIYAATVAAVQRRGHTAEAWRKAAARSLQRIILATPRGPRPIKSAADLGRLLDVLYTACFVTISYLVGPRASEILHLRVGCVRSLQGASEAGETGLTAIVGTIFKREADFHGRAHQWIAPPPAVHAISILEALSAPHRARTGRTEIWLRVRGHWLGASEWRNDCSGTVKILSTQAMRLLLRRSASWFDLPWHGAKPWPLSTHQGRKTFVRFAALRDRSALFALAQHLGHRERGITDYCYAGTDYVLNREIDAAILEQSVSAWEQMLSAPALGGRAGAEILAKRPRFRGARVKQDLKRYARMLVDAGLTLGVCDWGFCVYRQEHSACLGSTSAPNPVRREPSTCARCRNFVVGPQHRGYWQAQAERHQALLNEPSLPTQTLKIARERLGEANTMVRSIDRAAQATHHASR
jgi:integrase